MLQVGQQVVCINDQSWVCWSFTDQCWYGIWPDIICPEYRGIYTVRALGLNTGYDNIKAIKVPTLLLQEIVNTPHKFADGFLEPGWPVDLFRPVRETSIEVFQKLLVPTPPIKTLTPETVR